MGLVSESRRKKLNTKRKHFYLYKLGHNYSVCLALYLDHSRGNAWNPIIKYFYKYYYWALWIYIMHAKVYLPILITFMSYAREAELHSIISNS